jgi:CDP-glucose 4,6-dehydratase
MPDRNFWQGRRVLLTGHTGFKGSWLSVWLTDMGAKVVGLALAPPTEPSLFGLADIGSRMESRIGDIRDADLVRRVVTESRSEIIVHMAAQALVRPSYEDPIGTYSTNVMGTAHVLDAVRSAPSVKAVVSVTSDKCYENREWVWGYREGEPLGGHDPYSNSKACAELVSSAYRKSFLTANGVALASARAGNVIGGGDWATDRLIPDMVRALSAGEPVRIRNPGAVRPWQHVLEPLAGYLALAERLTEDGESCAEAWNFGPPDDSAVPVQWVVEKLVDRWGGGADWTVDGGEHPHEANYLKLDCSKARQILGFKPRLTLTRTLDWVVDWHRAVGNGESALETTCRQIRAFEADTDAL